MTGAFQTAERRALRDTVRRFVRTAAPRSSG
jgi:hypothetical protein